MPSLVPSGHQVRVPRHAARLVGRQAVVRGAGSKSRRKLDCQKTGIVHNFKNKIFLKIFFKNILPRIPIPTGTNLSQSDLLVDHRTTLSVYLRRCSSCRPRPAAEVAASRTWGRHGTAIGGRYQPHRSDRPSGTSTLAGVILTGAVSLYRGQKRLM